jgi:hypothetical protein
VTAEFNKDRCLKRNRQAALRYGIDTAHINFLKGPGEGAPVEYRNYGGSLPASDEEALAMINAMLPEGAAHLALSDVYIHYVEAANNNFIEDRYAFLGRDTLRNVARDAATGTAFMNSHRTGGLSTDGEFPFGKTFAGQYQEGKDAAGNAVQRSLLGFYMLRAVKPNGDAGPSTDDLDRNIRGGTLFDVSVGLFGGTSVCDVCDGDVSDYDECPHLPGTTYAMDDAEIESQKGRGVPDGRATYTIKDSRLSEISGVFDGAVRGAGFRKAVALASKLKGENLKLAREVYSGLSSKGEDELAHEGLFERLTEAIAEGFRRVTGGKHATNPAPGAENQPVEADVGSKEEAGMSDKQNEEELTRLRKDSEELALLKKTQRENAAKTFASDAVSKHKNLMPFGADRLQALFEQLSQDDERDPLGTGSRVGQLQELFAALPAHNLTKEQAAVKPPDGSQVLENDPDPEQKLAAEKRKNASAWALKQQPPQQAAK